MRYKGKKKGLSLRRKAIYTVLILIVVRLFSNVPVPFVNRSYFALMTQQNSSFNFFNALSGNGFSNLSVMTLSITPYISASIILELMGVVFPSIHEMRNGMDDDRKKYKKITVITGICLAAAQAVLMAAGFGRQGMINPFKWYTVILAAAIWTAGSAFAIFCGEYITDHFAGNGISLILAVNILSSYVTDFVASTTSLNAGKGTVRLILSGVIVAVVTLLLHTFVAWVQTSEKRVAVTYHNKSVRENNITNSLPIKLCPANVIPVIFSSTIMAAVGLLSSLKTGNVPEWAKYFTTGYWFRPGSFRYSIGAILYILMIIGLSYYYIGIFMNPMELAERLKKQGGMIQGVRPGKPTADYLDGIMKYTVFIGSVALCIISVVPMILAGLYNISRAAFLGTSVIIITGITLETYEAFKAEKAAKKARKSGGFLWQ